jgi:hypothetical protein
MGYWTNTTYVNHTSVAAVSDALTAIFHKEGMTAIAPPAERAALLVEPMQYDSALNNDLWGVAVFPGAESWTVIQTAPLELLSERCPTKSRMRLADLCVALSASAFQINVYDSTGTVLVEVSPAGQVAASGFNPSSDAEDPFEWNGMSLSEELFEAQFQLHPFQDLIADATSGDDQAAALKQRFGGANARYCDNIVSVKTLIRHQPFDAPGGSALYFKWSGPSRQRFAPAASWNEYRKTLGK